LEVDTEKRMRIGAGGRGVYGTGEGGSGSGSGSGSGGSGFGDAERITHFDKDWVERQGVSGRRVVFSGLPYMISGEAVRGLLGGRGIDTGLEDGDEAVKRLPE
jgi:hypothetical protein